MKKINKYTGESAVLHMLYNLISNNHRIKDEKTVNGKMLMYLTMKM